MAMPEHQSILLLKLQSMLLMKPLKPNMRYTNSLTPSPTVAILVYVENVAVVLTEKINGFWRKVMLCMKDGGVLVVLMSCY